MKLGAWVFCLCALLSAIEASAHWRRRRNSNYESGWSDWRASDFAENDASGSPKWHRKLCKKMGRLAGFVPGLGECNYGDFEEGSTYHDSCRGLKSKLQAEERKSVRLHEEVQKVKAEKWQNYKELMKEKSEKREMERQHRQTEQQIQEEKRQSKHLKSTLEQTLAREQTLTLDLEKEKAAKRRKEQEVRREKETAESKVRKLERDLASTKSARTTQCNQDRLGKDSSCQRQVAGLENKLKILEAMQATNPDIDSLLQNISEMASQLNEEQGAKVELLAVLEAGSIMASQLKEEQGAKLELLEALAAERAKNAYLSSEFDATAPPSGGSWPMGLGIITTVIALASMALFPLYQLRKEKLELQNKLNVKSFELEGKGAQLLQLQTEFNSELGGMMRADHSPENLGTDFAYHVHDEKVDNGVVRTIKIQCPGVRHSDVFVEIIFNGCIVTITRQASWGVDAAQWERKFQFRPSEGLFEFKEDQAMLDRGFLTLVFRAFTFQKRPFRFPKHFDLSETDVDGTWEYPQESGAARNVTEPSAHGTAPGRLEMTAAAAAEFQDHVVEANAAETSGSPIDTEDYEATAAAVAHVAMQHTAASSNGGGESVAQASPEVTGDDSAAKASISEGASEGFEKVNEEDVSADDAIGEL